MVVYSSHFDSIAETYLKTLKKLKSSSDISKSAFGETQNTAKIRTRFRSLKAVRLRILGINANPIETDSAGRVVRLSDPLHNYVLLYPRFFLPGVTN